MKIEEIRERVKQLVEPVIRSLGKELDHLELKRMGGKMLLRIFIDREGGVTIDDCESVSREIEAILDVEDPIPGSYLLEVSSPGLDRPLKGLDDFKRFCGRTIRLVTTEPVEKQTFLIGEIETVTDDSVVLVLSGKRKVTIPYGIISRARLEVEV